MGRALIVANRALGGVPLLDEVGLRVRAGRSRYHLVVPAERPEIDGVIDTERDPAEARLQAEIERLTAIGAEVTGEVVDGDALAEVEAVLAAEPFDEVIVCTLPGGLSNWLPRGLLDRIRTLVEVPVIHLTSPAGVPARMTTTAVRLSIYIGESDRVHGRPLYTEIVHRARDAGLAGATVLRGLEGFGASQVVHTARLLTFSEDLPMVIHLIDTPDRIDAFLPALDALVTEGVVVREEVDVIKYAAREATPS
jgi:PII-like signaling protein